jgi:uncharacterized protein (TIGR02302 family)
MKRLAKLRNLARAALLLEGVWPALWPPLGVAGVFLCAALLDLPPLLPVWAHIALLMGVTIAVVALTVSGLRRVALPSQAAADRRLEADSGLSHRPLAVLSDRPARADADGMALWQAHVARAVALLDRLRVGVPRPGLARRDPRALRAALVVSLAACVVIAGSDAPNRVAVSLLPNFAVPALSAPPELRAWITPPGYTGLPPVFLRTDVRAVSVPAGSHLTVSLTGVTGAATLSFGSETEAFRPLDLGSLQADRDLAAGGALTILRGTETIGRWDLTVIADRPPVVAWTAAPGRVAAGQETRLPWKAEDDYGVVSLQAEMRLEARPDAPPLVVSIPLPGGSTKTAKGTNQQDLTAHPWAGLPVIATLAGRDSPGQIGFSNPESFVLPERPFHNVIAKVLVEVRKGLSLHPDDRGDGLEALDTLLQQPDVFGDDLGAFLNLSAIYYKLVRDRAPAAIPEAQDRLWLLALHMEEGQTEPTARALEDARQAAKDALDALVKEPNQENRDALDERLKELQQAIDRHMQALMEEALRKGESMPVDPDSRPITQQDLERLADRAREAAREGHTSDAQRRMAELERMLDQLRNAKPGQENQRNAQQRQRGRQQMGAVQDMVAREGGLLDHTERRVDDVMRLRPPPSPSGSASPDPDSERDTDRRVQAALRRALGELMQQFGDLTGEIPPSLTEADQAMREAGRQLNQGRDKAAGDAVQAAIAALQKGAKEMGQAMARQFGPPQPGSGDEGGDGDEGLFGMTMPGGRGDGRSNGPLTGDPGRADPRGRDPLGRSQANGTSGLDETGDVTVPEEQERLRSQAIQQELRRRGAERERPQPELDYIDRLLKQF